MEATEFKDPKMEFFSPPKSGSLSPRFSPPQNGFHSPWFRIQDLEMTAVRSSSVEYTSLRDILPSASSSAAAVAMSPTPSSSWHEIPIRNPLVKHAAMAYLQPMSTPTTSFGDEGGLLGKLKAMCFCHCGGEYGCVGWLYDVVWRTVKEIFGELVSDRRRDSEEEDEDEEDEDDDKVD